MPRCQFVVVSQVHDENQGARDEHVYRVLLRRPCHPWASDSRRYELWVSTPADAGKPPFADGAGIEMDECLVELVKEIPV